MGLFGGGASAEVDPVFEEAIVSSTDDGIRETRRMLVKNEAGLKALLGDGELPLCACYFKTASEHDAVVLVTDRRTVTVRKNTIQKEMSHADVAETAVLTHANGKMIVKIDSHSSRLDYAPNDQARFEKIILLQVLTPREAQAICANIDQYVGVA